MREQLYISKHLELIGKDLIIEEDNYSTWAYLLDSENDNNIILDGFICSNGIVVKNTSDVKEFIDKGFAPPISKDYANEFTIQKDLTGNDFKIDIVGKRVSIFLKNSRFLVLDLVNLKSYSKAVSKSGPYGLPISTLI